ncbi:hypothetical protein O6H91_10G016400 [Diphasiastrum complanatum]|uniref:Uncharacterized protein n=1 Tax=Diphasiastrum complanatum TaxID=34168 RepID=A0ACC2CEM3_DIPCM|nr:hypothetical protein O6H91_10G016400 [Diphasiastrum complanatum]
MNKVQQKETLEMAEGLQNTSPAGEDICSEEQTEQNPKTLALMLNDSENLYMEERIHAALSLVERCDIFSTPLENLKQYIEVNEGSAFLGKGKLLTQRRSNSLVEQQSKDFDQQKGPDLDKEKSEDMEILNGHYL